jgi:5S rRNA maturation endonuclease (ribonuclease M5)
MPLKKGQIRLLQDYFVTEEPREDGEWYLLCPLHEDVTRSASINVYSAQFFCQAGCGGGTVKELIQRKSSWIPPNTEAAARKRKNGHHPERVEEAVNTAMVDAWAMNLMGEEAALDEIVGLRGLTSDTLKRFKIGWDRDKHVFTIPVYAPDGELWNVRRYTPRPKGDTKIWGLTGRNTPQLYPSNQLVHDTIIICEGEWDAIATIQAGYAAITRTGAATVWKAEWNELFRGKLVYICHDADETGAEANKRVARAVSKVAADVRIVELPYAVEKKHGKDLSDFWMEHDRETFERLLRDAKPWGKQDESSESGPETISVLDSSDARNIAKPVNLIVTIKGKKEPGYTVPRTAQLSCTRDAGIKCQFCPMKATGEAEVTINGDSPTILALIDATQQQLFDAIRQEYGALKCNKLVIEPKEYQSVEVLYGRPSLDHSDSQDAGSYKTIRITSVGRHDTLPNNTVVATGALHPNPRDQRNEYLAWELAPTSTALDNFQLDDKQARELRRFQCGAKQRPAKKLRQIAEAMSEHVTRITGRWEMHAVFDLTLHSALSFKFNGKLLRRGWLQSCVYGDTRTGKSEAARQLLRHYGAGEIVGGESASYAGLVGGLQQLGGKEWVVTWGVIPLNDRRAVVVDEISALSYEDIGHMSDLRSDGVVRISKIQQEATHARTRMLWLANPRNGGSMGQFTYGVDALRPLIGAMEDIARFDMAMAVTMHDVPIEQYNVKFEPGELKYTAEMCHNLIMWCWTRKPEQIVWTPSAEKAAMAAATIVGRSYIEDPPLVQAADIREKIARIATALAARLFSTDETYQKIVVKPEHVHDAVAFLHHIYGMETFGYRDRSDEVFEDRREAGQNIGSMKKYLMENRDLAKFLRSNASFRRQDLEEILNLSREEANGKINKLWAARMVRKDAGDIRVEPTLHVILRETK